MPSHPCNHTAVIRWLLFVCLLYSGSSLEAQIEAPTPVPTQEAPSKSNGTSDDSEVKIHNYQLKHAKAAEVLKLFKQLHGGENAVTIDERTNSIVFYLREAAATELLESLALLDSETPHPIIPSTPVLQGSSPQAPVPAKSKPAGPFVKFTFKHAKVADVLKILREVAPSDFDSDDMEGFVVDERTNSFIWKVDTVSLDFEEECKKLDTESPASLGKLKESASPYRPSDDIRSDGVSMSFQTLTISLEVDRSNTVESLKQRYNELEHQTHQLADKLKQSTSLSESQRAELQLAVRKSFEARQALQRAELADLAQRMKSMQQSIDMRDKLADKVVQRRVEDLLNPSLKWDAGKMSEQLLVGPKQVSSNPATPLPPSALPSNVSAPSVRGEPPASVIRKKIQGRWIVQTFSVGDKDALPELAGQVEVVIEGNSMRYLVGQQEFTGPIFLANCKELESPTLAEDGPLPIDFIHDPNGAHQTSSGIIACDETTLSICMASDEGRANKDFRPLLFVPGTKVILIECHRAEPEAANAVSVDEATWKSAVEQATSKLLLAYRVPPNIDPNEGPKVIALIDVDYQGKQEAVDLKEEIYEWIEDDVPVASPGRFTLLSRKFVDLAMIETKLRPSDLASSSPSFLENRQRILEHIRRHEVKLDSLLIPSLKHLGDSDVTRQNEFELVLEGFIDAKTSWIERVTLVRELRDHANQANKSNADTVSPATPAKELQDRLQGTWDVKAFQSDNQGDVRVSQVVIRGDLLLVNTIVDGKVLGTSPWKLVWPNSDAPFEIEAIWDPNSNPATTEGMPGRIAYDGKSFQIAIGEKRPNAICPGEEITYIDCVRATVPTENADQTAKSDLDLSTPQATLDTIDRYSVDHPMGVPVECFTDPALQELSGVMLQQLCFMSGLSQVGLQTGGVIGVKDNAPIIAGTAPSFHLSVDALLKDHSLPTPPEECTKAFELLAKLTLGAAFGSDESLVKPDRELFRLAAGILRSPKEFLPKAGELSERFNNISGDTESPKKESKAQPKYLIEIDGDEATATQIVDTDKPSVPMSFKLQRINQRWLVSEAFSDEILNQMISSMSQVLGAMSAIESEVANQRDSSDSKKAPDADKPLYSGHPISWWLDSYWDNATASPRTTENETQEYVASEAIHKLREKPECKATIEAALEKWFEAVEHEVNEGQLTRAAKCIVFAAGPKNQKLAFALFFAGILIVLELDKGTLTIESELEDVPIRIMQGRPLLR
jgi:hypothetical protein